MFRNLLNYIDLSYLNPLIQFLNDWYITIIILLATAGIIYAIILGIKLAKSDSSDERQRSKKRIINASMSIVIIIALTLILQFIFANLQGWVNGNEKNMLLSQEVVSNVTCSYDSNENQLVAKFDASTGTYNIELNDNTKYTFVFEVTQTYYDVTGGNEQEKTLSGESGEFIIDIYNDTLYIGSYKIAWTRPAPTE